MKRERMRRIGFLLLALLLLLVTISTTIALSTHAASCCVPKCVPCVILIKVYDSLRLLGGVIGLSVGLLALLLFLKLVANTHLLAQNMTSLVLLKARLNN